VSIGHEKFAQLEGPNSCFDKKTTSCSTRKACRKMFSRTSRSAHYRARGSRGWAGGVAAACVFVV